MFYDTLVSFAERRIIKMEMSYDGVLVMQSCYAMMDEEMCYVEGRKLYK